MKIPFPLALCLLSFASLLSAASPTRFGNVRASDRIVARYEKFELTFAAAGEWKNPFDPDEVAIDCVIETPAGETVSVPAFFHQDFRRAEVEGREQLAALGDPCWKVRFTPTHPGTYRYRLQLKDRTGTSESETGSFTCTPNSNKAGFIRVAQENPRYFSYENGEPFFAVGQNLLFSGPGGTYAMDKWVASIARSGGNFFRTWWCHANMDLESRVAPVRSLGHYDLQSAWRADHVLELAEQLGVAVMPTFETQQFLKENGWWKDFTYNAANGGPVAKPADYFTNARARELFRHRLRYIVARWSYSTAIFSWMFWNEVNSVNAFSAPVAADWHRDMAHYLRSIDPNRHIVHTNFSNLDGRAAIDDLPEMELVSTNLYTRHDSAESALWSARFMTAKRAKPYLLSEFGLGHQSRWAQNDPDGIALHDGLWGATFGGAAGGALVWEWDSWVDGQNLYHHYAPFAATVKDIPFHRFQWSQVKAGPLRFRDAARPAYFTNVFFEGFSTNYAFIACPAPGADDFLTLSAEGEVDRPECFNSELAPTHAPDRYDAQSRSSRNAFQLTMPRDGQLILHVPRLNGTQHPILAVTVDGQEVLRQPLARDQPDATWDYFGQFPVPLAAGPHRVVVENVQVTGATNFWPDRVIVAYELTNYRERHGPNLDVAGLQSASHVLLWLRNPEATWLFARLGRKPTPQPEGVLELNGIPEGGYTVIWRDTWTGTILGHDAVETKNGRLSLRTPAVERSAVARLDRITR